MSKVCETIEYLPAFDTFYDCRIENFHLFLQFAQKGESESSSFKILAANNKQIPVKLVISPLEPDPSYPMVKHNGWFKSAEDYVCIQVKVEAVDSTPRLKLVGTLKLVTDAGTTLLLKLGVSEANGQSWPFRSTEASAVEFYNSSRNRCQTIQNAFCVPRDSQSLHLKVHFATPGSKSSTTTIVPIFNKSKDGLTKLSSDLKALLTNTNDSADFSIVCEDQIFPCHETILRARSTVLDKMFQQKMKESIERKLIIEDLKKETVGIFLKYLYTGEVSGGVENLPELIYSADKYHIAELLELCYNKIPDDDEKIVDILLVANRHNFEELSKIVMQRFVTSNLPEVDVKILDILLIAEEHKLEEFKKVVLQKIMKKKARFMKNEEFMNKLEGSPSILMEFFKL